VPPRVVLLDTSYILALENRDDPHHEKAKALDRELGRENATLMLHWGILLEIADGYARMNRRGRGLALLATFEGEEGYAIVGITEQLFREAMRFYRARPDKEWGLTDCVSFALMKREGVSEALTADAHFRQAGFQALLLES
jgi:uncharacterized protein